MFNDDRTPERPESITRRLGSAIPQWQGWNDDEIADNIISVLDGEDTDRQYNMLNAIRQTIPEYQSMSVVDIDGDLRQKIRRSAPKVSKTLFRPFEQIKLGPQVAHRKPVTPVPMPAHKVRPVTPDTERALQEADEAVRRRTLAGIGQSIELQRTARQEALAEQYGPMIEAAEQTGAMAEFLAAQEAEKRKREEVAWKELEKTAKAAAWDPIDVLQSTKEQLKSRLEFVEGQKAIDRQKELRGWKDYAKTKREEIERKEKELEQWAKDEKVWPEIGGEKGVSMVEWRMPGRAALAQPEKFPKFAEYGKRQTLLKQTKEVWDKVLSLSEKDDGILDAVMRSYDQNFNEKMIPFAGALLELGDQRRLFDVAVKARDGKPLTDDEQSLLDATVALASAEGLGVKPGVGSRIAKMASDIILQMVPYMGEFAATGMAFGGARAGASVAARGLTSKIAGAITKRIPNVTAVLEEVFGKQAVQRGAQATATGVRAGMQAMMNPAAVGAETLERMRDRNTGRLSPDMKSIVDVTLEAEGDTFQKALGKAVANRVIEYATEYMGPAAMRVIGGAGKYAGELTRNLSQKMGADWVEKLKPVLLSRWFDKKGITDPNAAWEALKKTARWDGVVEETLEELLATYPQNVVEGRPALEGYDPESVAGMILGIAGFGGIARAAGTPVRMADKKKARIRAEAEQQKYAERKQYEGTTPVIGGVEQAQKPQIKYGPLARGEGEAEGKAGAGAMLTAKGGKPIAPSNVLKGIAILNRKEQDIVLEEMGYARPEDTTSPPTKLVLPKTGKMEEERDAARTRKEVKSPGAGEELEPGAEGQIPLRDVEEGGLEAGEGKEEGEDVPVEQPSQTRKEPWEMTYEEVRRAVSPENKEQLEASRPILRELYADKLNDVGDPWGIVRAVEKGDELPRTPTVDLSKRHRKSIENALSAGKPIPPEVLNEYPDLAEKFKKKERPSEEAVPPKSPVEKFAEAQGLPEPKGEKPAEPVEPAQAEPVPPTKPKIEQKGAEKPTSGEPIPIWQLSGPLPDAKPERGPTGKWFYGGGRAPVVLRYERVDGQPLTEQDAKDIQRFGIGMGQRYKTRVWATEGEAKAAAASILQGEAPKPAKELMGGVREGKFPDSNVSDQDINVDPSDKQKDAGNYKKGHVKWNGLDVSVENPKGSYRRGRDKSGKEWEAQVQADYGYIKGTKGKDKEHVDIFIGPNPESGKVFIVDQPNEKGELDEHKILAGFDSREEAEKAYYGSYEKAFADKMRPNVVVSETDAEGVKEWLEKGDKQKGAADWFKKAEPEQAVAQPEAPSRFDKPVQQWEVIGGKKYDSKAAAQSAAKRLEGKTGIPHRAQATAWTDGKWYVEVSVVAPPRSLTIGAALPYTLDGKTLQEIPTGARMISDGDIVYFDVEGLRDRKMRGAKKGFTIIYYPVDVFGYQGEQEFPELLEEQYRAEEARSAKRVEGANILAARADDAADARDMMDPAEKEAPRAIPIVGTPAQVKPGKVLLDRQGRKYRVVQAIKKNGKLHHFSAIDPDGYKIRIFPNEIGKKYGFEPPKPKDPKRQQRSRQRLADMIFIPESALADMPALRAIMGRNVGNKYSPTDMQGVKIGRNPVAAQSPLIYDTNSPLDYDLIGEALASSDDPQHMEWAARGASFDEIYEKAKDEISRYMTGDIGEGRKAKDEEIERRLAAEQGIPEAMDAEDFRFLSPTAQIKAWPQIRPEIQKEILGTDGKAMTPDELAQYGRVFFAGEWYDVKEDDVSVILEDGESIELDKIFDEGRLVPVEKADDAKKERVAFVSQPIATRLLILGYNRSQIGAMTSGERLRIVSEADERADEVRLIDTASYGYYISSGAKNRMHTLRVRTDLGNGFIDDRHVCNLHLDIDEAIAKARFVVAARNGNSLCISNLPALEKFGKGEERQSDGAERIIDESGVLPLSDPQADAPEPQSLSEKSPQAQLEAIGLYVEARQAKSGKTYWTVYGDLPRHEKMLDALGLAKAIRIGGMWVRSDFKGDPTERILEYFRTGDVPVVSIPEPEIGETDAKELLRKLKITIESSPDGSFVARGNTYDYRLLLHELNGNFEHDGKIWRFSYDPTRHIADAIKRGGAKANAENDPRPGDNIAEDERIRAIRSREDSRPDERISPDAARELVSADTRILIERGIKYGIPEEVVGNQIEDVGLIVSAFERAKSAFILANQPGTGKTFVLGGMIREMRRRGQDKFVYFTQSQDLIDQIKADLSEYGLEGVRFHTYAELSTKKIPSASGHVLIFDESQNVKNTADASRGRKAQELMNSSPKMTIFASATPFENPVEMSYLAPTGLFYRIGYFNDWAKAYGAQVRRKAYRHPKTKEIITEEVIYWLNKGHAEDAKAARTWLMKQGIMTQRPMMVPPGMVDVTFRKVGVEAKWLQMYHAVDESYQHLIDSYVIGEDGDEAFVANSAIVAAAKRHRINLLKRILEASKVSEVVAETRRQLRHDKNVVIFVETKAERSIGLWRKTKHWKDDTLYSFPQMEEMWEDYLREKAIAERMREKPPPAPFAEFIYEIAKQFHKDDIRYDLPSTAEMIQEEFPDEVAIYTGAISATAARKNKEAFLSGEKKILVATMAKGGTGLSLHDKVGDRPTVQLNLNLPWTSSQVEQVMGRVARYGLQSKAEIFWFFAGNIPFEATVLAPRVGARMRDANALVRGVEVQAAEVLDGNFDFEDDVDVSQLTADERKVLNGIRAESDIDDKLKGEAGILESLRGQQQMRPSEDRDVEADVAAWNKEIKTDEYGLEVVKDIAPIVLREAAKMGAKTVYLDTKQRKFVLVFSKTAFKRWGDKLQIISNTHDSISERVLYALQGRDVLRRRYYGQPATYADYDVEYKKSIFYKDHGADAAYHIADNIGFNVAIGTWKPLYTSILATLSGGITIAAPRSVPIAPHVDTWDTPYIKDRVWRNYNEYERVKRYFQWAKRDATAKIKELSAPIDAKDEYKKRFREELLRGQEDRLRVIESKIERHKNYYITDGREKLFVLRNMKRDELKYLEDGLMNNPSLAVTPDAYNSFGPITFVGTPGLVRPSKKGHFLYSGDAWTITATTHAADIYNPTASNTGSYTQDDFIVERSDIDAKRIKRESGISDAYGRLALKQMRMERSGGMRYTQDDYDDPWSGARVTNRRLFNILEHKIVGDVSMNTFPYVLVPDIIAVDVERQLREYGYIGTIIPYENDGVGGIISKQKILDELQPENRAERYDPLSEQLKGGIALFQLREQLDMFGEEGVEGGEGLTAEQQFQLEHPDEAVKGKYKDAKRKAEDKLAKNRERLADLRNRLAQLKREQTAGGTVSRDDIRRLQKEIAKITFSLDEGLFDQQDALFSLRSYAATAEEAESLYKKSREILAERQRLLEEYFDTRRKYGQGSDEAKKARKIADEYRDSRGEILKGEPAYGKALAGIREDGTLLLLVPSLARKGGPWQIVRYDKHSPVSDYTLESWERAFYDFQNNKNMRLISEEEAAEYIRNMEFSSVSWSVEKKEYVYIPQRRQQPRKPYPGVFYASALRNAPFAFSQRVNMIRLEGREAGWIDAWKDEIYVDPTDYGDVLHELGHRFWLRYAPEDMHEWMLSLVGDMDKMIGVHHAKRIRKDYDSNRWAWEMEAEVFRQVAEKEGVARVRAEAFGIKVARMLGLSNEMGKKIGEMIYGAYVMARNLSQILGNPKHKAHAAVRDFLQGARYQERRSQPGALPSAELRPLSPEMRDALLDKGFYMWERGIRTVDGFTRELGRVGFAAYGPKMFAHVYRAVREVESADVRLESKKPDTASELFTNGDSLNEFGYWPEPEPDAEYKHNRGTYDPSILYQKREQVDQVVTNEPAPIEEIRKAAEMPVDESPGALERVQEASRMVRKGLIMALAPKTASDRLIIGQDQADEYHKRLFAYNFLAVRGLLEIQAEEVRRLLELYGRMEGNPNEMVRLAASEVRRWWEKKGKGMKPRKQLAFLWKAHEQVFTRMGFLASWVGMDENGKMKFGGRQRWGVIDAKTIKWIEKNDPANIPFSGMVLSDMRIVGELLEDGSRQLYREMSPEDAEGLYRRFAEQFPEALEYLHEYIKAETKIRELQVFGESLPLLPFNRESMTAYLKRRNPPEYDEQGNEVPGTGFQGIDNYVHSLAKDRRKALGLLGGVLRKRKADILKYNRGILSEQLRRDWNLSKSQTMARMNFLTSELKTEQAGVLLALTARPLGKKAEPGYTPLVLDDADWRTVRGMMNRTRNLWAAKGVNVSEVISGTYRLQGKWQIPIALRDELVGMIRGPQQEDVDPDVAQVREGVGKLFNAVVNSINSTHLIRPGTAATNFISGELQLLQKTLTDIIYAVISGGSSTAWVDVRQDFAVLLRRLSPRARKEFDRIVPNEAITVLDRTFFQDLGNTTSDEGVTNRLLIPFQMVEVLFKSRTWDMVVHAEAEKKARASAAWQTWTDKERKDAILELAKDPTLDIVEKARKVSDEFTYDYANIPRWLANLKKKTWFRSILPYPTYAYKWGTQLAKGIWGVTGLVPEGLRGKPGTVRAELGLGKLGENGEWAADTRVLNAMKAIGYTPQHLRMIARFLATGGMTYLPSIFMGGGDDEEDFIGQIGRLTDPEGQSYTEHWSDRKFDVLNRALGFETQEGLYYLRCIKYPFVREAMALAQMREEEWSWGDYFGDLISEGSLAQTGIEVLGYSTKYDKEKPLGTKIGERLAQDIPFAPYLNDLAGFIDPKLRRSYNKDDSFFPNFLRGFASKMPMLTKLLRVKYDPQTGAERDIPRWMTVWNFTTGLRFKEVIKEERDMRDTFGRIEFSAPNKKNPEAEFWFKYLQPSIQERVKNNWPEIRHDIADAYAEIQRERYNRMVEYLRRGKRLFMSRADMASHKDAVKNAVNEEIAPDDKDLVGSVRLDIVEAAIRKTLQMEAKK